MIVTIVGGGAAGFFTAIQIKEKHPEYHVQILEKSKKILSKVKVSGGGRCNVTNAIASIGDLSKGYPRGERQLRKLFGKFNNMDMMEWLENNGIELKTYPDQCVFPKVNDSQIVIDLFLKKCSDYQIEIKTETPIESFQQFKDGYHLQVKNGEQVYTDRIVFALGGQPKRTSLEPFEKLGYKLIDPVPSLFTFNMPGENTANLMGVVVEDVVTRIEGEKLEGFGPLLFTHWGLSGPAILMLSSKGARVLAEKKYEFRVRINWLNSAKENDVRSDLEQQIKESPNKLIKNQNPFQLPSRLWESLILKSELALTTKWNEIGKKSLNKMQNILINDSYEVKGKTTFKEEFVTAGGIALENLNMKTMESKLHPGVYFIGEMIDIDGITGGYNFQACWTEAWTVANSI